jgi:hypothetical protein
MTNATGDDSDVQYQNRGKKIENKQRMLCRKSGNALQLAAKENK